MKTTTKQGFSAVDAIMILGLAGSGLFTVTLFLDVYGWDTLLGWVAAFFALAWLEMGAYAWRSAFEIARGYQRPVAGLGMFVCAALSVASTIMQIILSSHLWQPGWDEGAWTIGILAGAVGVNVIGAVFWKLYSPDVQAIIRAALDADS